MTAAVIPARIWAHYDKVCVPLDVQQPDATPFAEVQAVFEDQLAKKGQSLKTPLAFFNGDGAKIPKNHSVSAWLINGLAPDFFLKSTHVAPQRTGVVKDSVESKGELSYYYAHAPAEKEPFAQQAPPRPVEAPAGVPMSEFKHNFKASPFGTNIELYESIVKYAWEDSNDNTVKVIYFLDDAPSATYTTNYAERSFEILIETKDGKRQRLAVAKTHGKMIADQCKHKVSSNRVTIYLRKAEAKQPWFDLRKKKGIGEGPSDDEAPKKTKK
jgi:hypothetical protein